MEVRAYIDALESEGTLLADSAAVLDPDASVPTCPDWTLRDLVLHLAGVHRWAGSHVRDRLNSIMQTDLLDLFDQLPDNNGLIDWYRGELRLLISSARPSSSASVRSIIGHGGRLTRPLYTGRMSSRSAGH